MYIRITDISLSFIFHLYLLTKYLKLDYVLWESTTLIVGKLKNSSSVISFTFLIRLILPVNFIALLLFYFTFVTSVFLCSLFELAFFCFVLFFYSNN